MPEGDTIYRVAATLQRVLAGHVVVAFDSVFPALTRVADDRPIVGRTIASVSSVGKHLLIGFSGDLVLHTHMRMNGSWHVYPADARWHRPAREMRVLVGTARAMAVGFNIPVAEFLTTRDLTRHHEMAALGPDLLDPAFDAAAAHRRIRTRPADVIGDVLLNQRMVAGIGNVLKCETLFVAGVNPFATVAQLSDRTISRVIEAAVALLRRNVADRVQTLVPTTGRRTTGSLHPAKGLWVYGRAGEPCRRCGTRVEVRKSAGDARLTFWCPACQPPSGT